MRQARLVDPIADPAWLALVEGCPAASVFSHPRWLQLLRDQYSYELGACCVENGNGIEAGIPVALVASRLTGKRLVALPFSDLCEPVLASGADPAALTALSRELVGESRRRGLDLVVHGPLPETPGAVARPRYFHHRLPLGPDPETVERGYSKSQVRRGVKRARREGLRVERRRDGAALDAFYALHQRTRRRLGVPTQPKRFVRRLEGLFAAGLGFVGLAVDGDRPIAAAVFLTSGDTVTYKYGASDPARLGKRPNHLLFAEVIRWACGEGFGQLDFGRTDLGNEGLRRFKRSWGATESTLSYTFCGEAPAEPGGARRERLLGGAIRRSPPFVSRLVGEALYRHFG